MAFDTPWTHVKLRARQLTILTVIVGAFVAYTCNLICALSPDGCGQKVRIGTRSQDLSNASSHVLPEWILNGTLSSNGTAKVSNVNVRTDLDPSSSLGVLHVGHHSHLTVSSSVWKPVPVVDTPRYHQSVSVDHFKVNAIHGSKEDQKSETGLRPRQDDGPRYDDHILCIGQNLLSAITTQDVSALKESSFTDDEIVQEGSDWEFPHIYTDGLASFIWGDFVKQYFPGDAPKVTIVYWAGPLGRNFGTAFESIIDAPRGILVASNMFVKRTAPPDIPHRASDIIFLQWKRVAKQTNDVGNIKWVLIQLITNFETIETLNKACPGKSTWPGCAFDPVEKPRDSAAILGTPNGRFVGWMILNRPQELPHRTVKRIIAFQADTGLDEDGWNLIFEIGKLEGEALVVRADVSHKLVHLQKRDKNWRDCLCTGKAILERLAQQTELTPSTFTEYAALLNQDIFFIQWEWGANSPGSFDDLFLDLGISTANADWVEWRCDGHTGSLAMGVHFVFLFHIRSGTIVVNQGFRAMHSHEDQNIPFKNSDFLFLVWQELCRRTGTDVGSLKRILRETIINGDTRGAVTEVCLRNRVMVPPIPPYPGFIAQAGTDDLAILLGTPNALSSGWLLINRATAFPRMTVTSIQFFGSGMTFPFNMVINFGPLPEGP